MAATRPVALVTGASSGIADAAAVALVEAGFQVTGTSRDTSRITARTGVTYLELFREAWLQDPTLTFTDPRISLINADLTGLPPTVVHYGEHEILAGDGAELARRLADFNVTTEVHPMPEGQKSFILAAGRVPEVDQAIDQMGQWLGRHLGAENSEG